MVKSRSRPGFSTSTFSCNTIMSSLLVLKASKSENYFHKSTRGHFNMFYRQENFQEIIEQSIVQNKHTWLWSLYDWVIKDQERAPSWYIYVVTFINYFRSFLDWIILSYLQNQSIQWNVIFNSFIYSPSKLKTLYN